MNLKVGLAFFLLEIGGIIAKKTCTVGTCMSIQECPKLLNTVIKSSRTSADYEILRQRDCGYDNETPLVCCTDEEKNAADSSNLNVNQNDENTQTIKSVDVITLSNLLPNDCGQDSSSRIYGGNVTDIDEYPWMTILEYRSPAGMKLSCSGSLISKRYVLTAAHCVKDDGLPTNWILESVRLGEYNTATKNDCIPDGEQDMICAEDPVSINIEEKVVHEKYRSNSADRHNDIALLRLSRDVNFTNYIKPICLPDNARIENNFIVAGWGLTESSHNSEVKLKVALPLVESKLCKATYANNKQNSRQLDDSQICAGGKQGQDTCKGDSGGPLMQRAKWSDASLRWVIAGVTSYGPTPCGQEGWPGVYTNVYTYKSWILNNMRL